MISKGDRILLKDDYKISKMGYIGKGYKTVNGVINDESDYTCFVIIENHSTLIPIFEFFTLSEIRKQKLNKLCINLKDQ